MPSNGLFQRAFFAEFEKTACKFRIGLNLNAAVGFACWLCCRADSSSGAGCGSSGVGTSVGSGSGIFGVGVGAAVGSGIGSGVGVAGSTSL